MNLGVLCSGSGTNLQAILEATRDGLLRGIARVAVVVADRPEARALDRARAFDPPVPAVLVDPGRPVDRDALDANLCRVLREHGVEVVCLAGYLRLVGPGLLSAFPDRVLNIHPALLPCFPGLHAQRLAIEHGVRVAGCTVHLVDEGVDSGPIVAQAAVPVYDGDDEEALRRRILIEEHRIYPLAVRLLCEGRLSRRGRRVLVRDARTPPDTPALRCPDADALL
jgi:phosphoribosylglycinamide formyltransferase 1